MMTAISVPQIPKVGHAEAMDLAAAEYARFTALLHELGAEDWERPTVCDTWEVRDVVSHVLGAAVANASLRENVRLMRLGRRIARDRGYDHWIHGANEVQVRERRAYPPAELIRRWESAAPKALAARRRFPPFLRPMQVKFPDPLGKRSMAYLMDQIYTRDLWMHRIDISRATGRAPILTAEHDGRLIADMVADWATTHGHPFHLDLTGTAGGQYTQGQQGEHLHIDAVDWIWTVSGRANGTAMLAKMLPL